jgi:ribosomal subunit interface protein
MNRILNVKEYLMQSPLKLTIHGVDRSEALEARIRAKVEKLEEFFDHITTCHVVVELPHKHQQQGSQFNVRIDIVVPGNEIVVTRDHAEDIYVALRDAFDAASRQLKDYAQKLRRDVKNHEPKRSRESEELGEALETESGEGVTE